MPLTRLIIKNFKSIKNCDISLSELNVLIGENGTGKTNLLDAISYFYRNLTDSDISEHVFDENNHYSNELRITLVYDLSQFVKISKSNSGELPDIFEDQFVEKTKYGGYYKTIISMASKSKDKKLCVELSQIKGRPIRWNYSYEDRLIFKSLFPIFYIDTRNLDVTEWGYLWGVLGELGKVSNAERKTIETKINDILLDESQEISRKLKEITDIFSAADVSVKPAMSREFAKNLTKVFFGQKELVLNGYVISDREIRLSRNRLSDIRRIVKFSKENHHLIDQFGPEKFILEANKLPLKYRNLNVYPFGTVFQFVQYMCGYRAFLISMTNNNYTLTPFQKELQRLIRRIEAQITRLI